MEGLVTMSYFQLPDRKGLYDPIYEHDSCGVGFVVNIKGKKLLTFC